MNQIVENLSTDALSPDARALKNQKFDLTYCQVPFNMAVNNYTIFIWLYSDDNELPGHYL